MYHDEVMRLRKEVRSLRTQLGDKVGTGNEDIFGEQPIGAKELDDLQAQQKVLGQRLAVEQDRQLTRERAYRELEQAQDSEAQGQLRRITRKPLRKGPPDNSDILMSTPEQQAEFKKWGGM